MGKILICHAELGQDMYIFMQKSFKNVFKINISSKLVLIIIFLLILVLVIFCHYFPLTHGNLGHYVVYLIVPKTHVPS